MNLNQTPDEHFTWFYLSRIADYEVWCFFCRMMSQLADVLSIQSSVGMFTFYDLSPLFVGMHRKVVSDYSAEYE